MDQDFPATDKELIEAGAAFFGGAVAETRRSELGELLFKCALWIDGSNPDALSNMATCALKKGEADKGRLYAARAVAMNPSHNCAWAVLGQSYNRLGKFLDAKLCIERQIEIEPNRSEFWYMLAGTYEVLGDYDRSEECHKKALDLNPGDNQVQFSWGMIKMLRGDYSYGLPLYEKRMSHFQPKFEPSSPTKIVPLLNSGINNLTIDYEQGVGDLFQMARYADMLRRLYPATKLNLRCPDDLAGIMSRVGSFSNVWIYSYTTPLKHISISAMSLPYLASIIGQEIKQPPVKMNIDDLKRAGIPFPMMIGLCRSGNPHHANDRFRSIPEPAFEPLERAVKDMGLNTVDLSKPSGTWDDTLKLILECDLIITVDTAVAHLAATVGRPVWMFVSAVPDWRWGLESETTGWYPSMQLFRQKEPLKWEPVIARVVSSLHNIYTEEP